jgi:hypothetical protein
LASRGHLCAIDILSNLAQEGKFFRILFI